MIYVSYETENLYTAELERKQRVNEGKITYAAYNTPFKIHNEKMYPAFLCLLIPGASPLLLCTKEKCFMAVLGRKKKIYTYLRMFLLDRYQKPYRFKYLSSRGIGTTRKKHLLSC